MKDCSRSLRSGSACLAAFLGLALWANQGSGQPPAGDWSQFRGPGGLGASPAHEVPQTWSAHENLAWKRQLPGAGASSPVSFGNRLFLTCYDGYGVPGQSGKMEDLRRHVICIDRNDGKVLWNKEVETRLPEQPTIRENHGYATSTPVVDHQNVYAYFGKSGVFAFTHEGKQLWHTEVGSGLNGWGSAASPVLAGDLLLINASVESESLIALDRKSGKEVWRAGGIRESWNTPLLVTAPGGRPEVIVAIQGKVLSFDPKSGQSLWSCATDIRWYMVPSLVAHEGIVYCIGGRTGGALAVRCGGNGDVTRTHRLWTGAKGSNVSSLVYHDGHLYWAHDTLGIVYCAEARTGKLLYEQRLERAGQIYASPIIADGKLYYVARNGRTFVVAAKPQFELLAVNDLADRSVFNASPALVAGKLLLRSDRFLYCIGRKAG